MWSIKGKVGIWKQKDREVFHYLNDLVALGDLDTNQEELQ